MPFSAAKKLPSTARNRIASIAYVDLVLNESAPEPSLQCNTGQKSDRKMINNVSIFRQLCSLWLVFLLLIPSLPLEAKNRKGDRLLNEGRKLEAKRDFEGALEFYEKALNEDGSDVGYQIAARRARFESSQIFVKKGQKLREAGNLEEALGAFSKALVLDPSSTIAIQEMRRTKTMLDAEQETC